MGRADGRGSTRPEGLANLESYSVRNQPDSSVEMSSGKNYRDKTRENLRKQSSLSICHTLLKSATGCQPKTFITLYRYVIIWRIY